MKIQDTLIGSAISQKARAELLCNELTDEHFVTNEQRHIFNAIKSLVDNKKDVNLVSIATELPTNVKQMCIRHLAEISKAPCINFEQVLEQVKRQRYKSILQSHAVDLIAMIRNNTGDIPAVMDNLYQTHVEMSKPPLQGLTSVNKLAELGFRNLFKDMKYVKTGILGVDDIIYGFVGGELVTIAARPGGGKSAMAVQVANYIGGGCLFYSLEMKARDNYARMLSSMTGVSIRQIMARKYTDYEGDALDGAESILKDNKLEFIDTMNNVKDISIDIRNKCLTREIKCVMIDYVQIIRVAGNDPRHIQIGKITKELKQIAMEFNIPIVIMAQLGRGYDKENREPRLSDLRESGDIENDSDKVIFIHLVSENNMIESPPCKVIIAKNRNGKVGYFDAYFNKSRFVFETIKN